MPFKNKAQMRACFAEKRRNPDSKWNCQKWIKEGGVPRKPGPKARSAAAKPDTTASKARAVGGRKRP
jgi:hypothetical protein